jgi:trehalose-6-phosphate synthase
VAEAVSLVRESTTIMWFGMLDIDVGEHEREEVAARLKADARFEMHVVWIERETAVRWFDGYCKGILWQAFHYMGNPSSMMSTAEDVGMLRQLADTANWDAYLEANESFAQARCRAYHPYIRRCRSIHPADSGLRVLPNRRWRRNGRTTIWSGSSTSAC